MKSKEDIERYLLDADLNYKEVGDGIWLINDDDKNLWNLIIRYEEPVLLFRIKIMELPKENTEKLLRLFLQFNSEDLLHSSYGIENDTIVLSASLQLENLDFNEFQAVIDDLSIAMSTHLPKIKQILSERE